MGLFVVWEVVSGCAHVGVLLAKYWISTVPGVISVKVPSGCPQLLPDEPPSSRLRIFHELFHGWGEADLRRKTFVLFEIF